MIFHIYSNWVISSPVARSQNRMQWRTSMAPMEDGCGLTSWINSHVMVTLWWTYKKLWKITIFNGKIHYKWPKSPFLMGKLNYFDWAIFNIFLYVYQEGTTRWYHGTKLAVDGAWLLRSFVDQGSLKFGDAKNYGHYLRLKIIPKSGCTTLKPFINLGT